MERNSIKVFDAISDLQNISGADKDVVLIRGSSGGMFTWEGASSASPDGDMVVAVTNYSANGRWVRMNRLGSVNQIEITGTTANLSLGDDFWKDITSNLTLTLSNATDGKKANILIRNTGASAVTVTITGVDFPSGSDNEIPAGGKAYISLSQVNGEMNASIVIYDAPTT